MKRDIDEQETKYSRIPVYSGEIDRISGVVLSKDLLDFVQVRTGRGRGARGGNQRVESSILVSIGVRRKESRKEGACVFSECLRPIVCRRFAGWHRD